MQEFMKESESLMFPKMTWKTFIIQALGIQSLILKYRWICPAELAVFIKLPNKVNNSDN